VVKGNTFVEVRKMRVETEYEVEDSRKEDYEVLLSSSSNQGKFVLNTKDECEMNLVGGKAFNVSKLSKKGFPVPEGFCVSTRAYEYFMDFNSISEEDEKICDKIRNGLMPPLLTEYICHAYREHLKGRACAVRSSSPFEDLKSASFAGQYESFLNVKGEKALLDAVKGCWASLWNQSAVGYRKKMGIESTNIKMAVLVQEMVSATASGVLFTDDHIVVEAVWGLGDILVGGEVIPDHFVAERKEFNVTERKISRQEVMSQFSFTGGVETVEVLEDLRDVPVLDDEHIRKLCGLGEHVEELFGCPQDIEWALCNGRFVLLQARPITVKQQPTIWSRANAAEMQPGYVTYLSRIPENKPDDIVLGLRPLLERFGIKDIPEDIKFREYIYGHVYLNMTTVHNTLGKIPGLSPEVLDQSLGHSGGEEEVQESKMGLSAMMKLLPGTLRVIQFFLSLSDQAEKVMPHSLELIEDIRQRDLHTMSLEGLDELAWEMYERNSQVFQVHSVTALATMSLFGVLQKLTARMGEEGTENLLTIGLEGMSSSQLGVEMWQVAQIAAESPRVSELILSRREGMVEELKQFPEGVTFLAHLDTFMDAYGDRCSEELELSVPRWEEDPDFVLSMVANYLGSDVNPAKTMEEQKKIRLEATGRIRKKLSKNPLEALIFEKILQKTQQYIVVRENLKTTWMKGLSTMRILYMAIAENLVKEGILKSKEDIFYLKVTEVFDVIAGNLRKGQFEDHIEERKKERLEYEHLDVPEVIVGKPLPIEELKYTVEPKEQFEGTGCSHGVVTGKARVVSDPLECSEFKKGEILVAPITDPGWSPLFVTAGGLVMELGGTLSHGVIIAREYGIPAVVGVKNATKIIKTGQVITVDGNKGIVYIRE
jgi:phosphohistidine swiveling domain-containing protein